MKLFWKLAISQICIVVCLGLVSFVVINSYFENMRERYVRDIVENRFAFVTKEIEDSSRKAVDETSLFINMPIVLKAYEIALSGDIDDPYSPQSEEARELLRREFAPILEGRAKITGEKPKLHFHLPNGRSLVRLWRDKNANIDGVELDISDDLSALRPTVMNTNRTGNLAMGIESGLGGFVVRGVVPITAPDGRHLGSAEVLQDFTPILDSITDRGVFSFALYANDGILEYAADLRDREKYPVEGNFVRIFGAEDPVDSLITAALLEKGKNNIVYEDFSSVTLAAFPLNDYWGNQAGVIILALDIEDISTLTRNAELVLAFMLAGMVAAPILTLLLRLRSLVTGPLERVKVMIQDIAVDRADLTSQIPASQKDEIGELAKWFNMLTARLWAILNERQEMLKRIHSESEKFEKMANWYGSILDSVPFPVSVTDADMKWTFVNKAVETVLGRKSADMIGKPCGEWNAPICGTADCGINCLKRGIHQTYFVRNGISYQVDVTSLVGLRGEITGFIEVVQDISRLEQLRLTAEAESRAKTIFLANMSHEIRTPLNAITGMTSIGKSTEDPGRMKYCFARIENASAHLLGVINDILDMSKIEAGKFELSPAEFNFEKALQRVAHVIGFRADEKRQSFTVHIDKAIPKMLIGDDQRVAQVLTNLLGNAIKFTPEKGSVTLDTRLLEEKDGVCSIQIAVRDTGIGISASQQSKLFQSFQQAEAGTTRKFGGTGLGLVISKSIVEMMGGKIWVESEPDKGSSFVFTIQMKRGQVLPEEAQGKQIDWSNVSVMVVDDDPIILELMKETIQGFGISCDTAASGEEALALVERGSRYDIFFIDWKMQGIDGIALAGMLKEKESKNSSSTIIMISAADLNLIEKEARKAGVAKFLSKPLFPSDVFYAISESFGAARENTERAAPDISGCFAGRSILLVEDIEINREIVLALLEPTLVEIDCAENGAEAVRMFSAAPGKYDVIFMDVQMPEMDGYEATRQIRAIEKEFLGKKNDPLSPGQSKGITIIAMTANVFRDDIEKCLAAGMNSHIGKPLDFNEVLSQLRAALS